MDDTLSIETRSPEELQALKVARFTADPKCQACGRPIERLADAQLITKVLHSTRGDRTVLAHTGCLGLAFTQIANRAIRMGNLR